MAIGETKLINHTVTLEDDYQQKQVIIQRLNCKHNLASTLVVYEL